MPEDLGKELTEVKQSKEALENKEKLFSHDTENDKKKEDLQAYNKAMEDYRKTVTEFNDGDGTAKWKKSELDKLNLSDTEKKLFSFKEIQE